MTVTNAVATTYLLATGKTTTLTEGSTKYDKILALLNMFSANWASEAGVDWKSLRITPTVSGGVTATDTFAIPTTLAKLSKTQGDFVRIVHADGVTESDYAIVPIERLYNDGSKLQGGGAFRCAESGSNLIFDTPFTAQSPQFGGTIYVPGYMTTAELQTGTDVIQVDDPYWLCFMSAAEYVRNDITRVQQYGNLVAQANNAMLGMKEDNNSQEEKVTSTWAPLGSTWE